MLAHALEEVDRSKIDPAEFAAEWKWDGIRVQAVCDSGVRKLYSRSGEDITDAFPDVVAHLSFEGAIDGELLVRTANGEAAPFNDLQQRLNRKKVDRATIEKYPAFIRAYDLLADAEDDLRALPFEERRVKLEDFILRAGSPRIDISPLVDARDWRRSRRRAPIPLTRRLKA